MPSDLRLWVSFMAHPELRAELRAIRNATLGFDTRAFTRATLHDPHWVHAASGQVLATRALFADLELGRVAPDQLSGVLELTASATGTADGLACWFSASLSEDIEITNGPLSGRRINREILFLPFQDPIRVSEGEAFRVRLGTRRDRVFYAWQVQRLDQAGGLTTLCKQTSLPSTLLTKQRLAQTAPDFTPELGQRGRARRQVLDLCDGCRPLTEIIDLVFSGNPDTFPSRDRAAGFVADVLKDSIS
jgi:hypothetical protein